MSNARRLRRSVTAGGRALTLATAAAEGRLNAYRCPKCGGYTVTIDVNEGVTPMFLGCRASGSLDGCDGTAESMMYPPLPWPPGAPKPIPAWEWYMPVGKEAEKLRRGDAVAWDHVRNGGLMLRPAGGTP